MPTTDPFRSRAIGAKILDLHAFSRAPRLRPTPLEIARACLRTTHVITDGGDLPNARRRLRLKDRARAVNPDVGVPGPDRRPTRDRRTD